MAIAYPAILGERSSGVRRWDRKDAILYALGIGLPGDALDPAALIYVDEQRLVVAPTFAAILAYGLAVPAARLGFDLRRLVHGAQAIAWHRAIPPAGAVIGEGRVVGAWDKGAKGAVVVTETLLRDMADGAPIATVTVTYLARGDGGFGGPAEPPPLPSTPDRAPDRTLRLATQASLPLLYRLSGDRNPIHIDPAAARKAGFERPILHGLCSFGMIGHAMVMHCADGAADRLAALSARFSAPVYPGETLALDLWTEDRGGIAFSAHVVERGVVALTGGRARIRRRPGP